MMREGSRQGYKLGDDKVEWVWKAQISLYLVSMSCIKLYHLKHKIPSIISKAPPELMLK
mgnify:CR=1 FL=1